MFIHLLPLVLAMSVQAPPPFDFAQGAPSQVEGPQSPPPQQPQQAAPAQASRPVRKLYDEAADAKAKIAEALKAAVGDDIRVLINWGANDSESCTKFPQSLRGNPMTPAQSQISTKLGNEYRQVYVDVGHLDKNQDLARAYNAKLDAASLPYFTILDKNGKVLENKSARDFAAESDPSKVDADKLLATLLKHQVPPTDSAPLFAAAVKKAKAENKEVFLWFSAPW